MRRSADQVRAELEKFGRIFLYLQKLPTETEAIMHIPGFFLEIALAATIGLLVALHMLNRIVKGRLTDLCGTNQRTACWSRLSLLVPLMCPLLGTLLLIGDQEATASLGAAALREALRFVLANAFVTPLAVGFAIWRSIDRQYRRPPLHPE